MESVKNIEIKPDDAGQRLDRFLRKYLPKATLSGIYKIIRKDVKVNGKRSKIDTFLEEGDIITLYLDDKKIDQLSVRKKIKRADRTFKIIYESDNVLIVFKPSGILTHGDANEKKNHLTNQVLSYLIDTGSYNPRFSNTFSPSPANRLDRNTSGLVVFGKNTNSLRRLNEIFKNRDIEKSYLTICQGIIEAPLDLHGYMEKIEVNGKFRTSISEKNNQRNKAIHTKVNPLKYGEYKGVKYTLTEVELMTGRMHQIRAHLSYIGHPIVGDSKYGGRAVRELEIRNQLLCANKLNFPKFSDDDILFELSEKTFETEPDHSFVKAANIIFKGDLKK